MKLISISENVIGVELSQTNLRQLQEQADRDDGNGCISRRCDGKTLMVFVAPDHLHYADRAADKNGWLPPQ
ncbi:MAG: hypothetical protein JWL83_68 [Actinomycetia bacterium]|nr:hypothetical protein [Actinomycetes bacterium]